MHTYVIFDRSTNVEHTTSIFNSTFILWRSYCFLFYLFIYIIFLFFDIQEKIFLLIGRSYIWCVLIYQSSCSYRIHVCVCMSYEMMSVGDDLDLKYLICDTSVNCMYTQAVIWIWWLIFIYLYQYIQWIMQGLMQKYVFSCINASHVYYLFHTRMRHKYV